MSIIFGLCLFVFLYSILYHKEVEGIHNGLFPIVLIIIICILVILRREGVI